jgi:hypothetical protein
MLLISDSGVDPQKTIVASKRYGPAIPGCYGRFSQQRFAVLWRDGEGGRCGAILTSYIAAI